MLKSRQYFFFYFILTFHFLFLYSFLFHFLLIFCFKIWKATRWRGLIMSSPSIPYRHVIEISNVIEPSPWKVNSMNGIYYRILNLIYFVIFVYTYPHCSPPAFHSHALPKKFTFYYTLYISNKYWNAISENFFTSSCNIINIRLPILEF